MGCVEEAGANEKPVPPVTNGEADRDSTHSDDAGPPPGAEMGSGDAPESAWKGFSEGARVEEGFLPLGGMIAVVKKKNFAPKRSGVRRVLGQ